MFQGVAPLPHAAAYFTDLIARGVVVPERLVGALAVRYRIERELGARGMATVYLAHDLRLAPVGAMRGNSTTRRPMDGSW